MVSGFLDLNLELVAEDIRYLISKFKEENDNPHQNYTTYFNADLRRETESMPWYTDFANSMKDMYVLFLREQYGREVRDLTRHDIHFFAWVNLYGQENAHEAHNHMRSTLSGTWYIKVPKNAGDVTFYNPSMEAVFTHCANDNPSPHPDAPNVAILGTQGSQTQLIARPEDGQFLMWPSYLLHSIAAGGHDDPDYERICISFNLHHHDPLETTTTGDQMKYSFLE
jgi:uncharacterized protein (TIGR02466 family)